VYHSDPHEEEHSAEHRSVNGNHEEQQIANAMNVDVELNQSDYVNEQHSNLQFNVEDKDQWTKVVTPNWPYDTDSATPTYSSNSSPVVPHSPSYTPTYSVTPDLLVNTTEYEEDLAYHTDVHCSDHDIMRNNNHDDSLDHRGIIDVNNSMQLTGGSLVRRLPTDFSNSINRKVSHMVFGGIGKPSTGRKPLSAKPQNLASRRMDQKLRARLKKGHRGQHQLLI